MEISAIILARVLGFIETADLNPQGRVFFPKLVHGLVERFQFQKYPQTLEEMDDDKGINFFEGTWGGVSVDKVTIFRGAIAVDTSASTDESGKILDVALTWAAENFGITYRTGMIKRWKYVSDLTFYSRAPLLGPSNALSNLKGSVSQAVSEIFGEPIQYEPSRLDLDFDKFQRPLPTASFSIQRRGEIPFSDNKYFSEAPLPTDVHIRILKAYEGALAYE